MASSYALPASAITNSHHGHNHHLSHPSHSPNRPSSYSVNTPRALRQERSTGSLHAHTHSEPQHHNRSHDNGRPHSHERAPRAPSPLSNYLPTPPGSNGSPRNSGTLEKHTHEHTHDHTPEISQMSTYEPPHHHDHDHDHTHAGHSHAHSAHTEPRSRFTNLILPIALRWPLLHTILAEKDSRRIFYFMTLNFAFMVVQACYGFLTDSLGLLSDSIHMFFDCLALGVGLFAAVAAKWPPSERFPYGFGKIESLSGFGNGVFLMLISIEIMIEATERLAEGRPTKRLMELFVVSTLGLAVNLVGMACFGHHHHGHDHGGHGHSHDPSHSHSNSHEKPHSHDETHHHHHDHACSHSKDTPLLSSPSSPVVKPTHSHSHDNENMHGIFLHVLADTMGSAAVMVSTALIYFIGWNGWDPVASCVIAILIFLSSIPLIKSSAKKLLLTIPDDVEYNLRDTLAGVSNIRGVASYAVPRFWMGDGSMEGEDKKVLGVMHVSATRGSDPDDVRERTMAFLLSHGVNVVVQVEKDGDVNCWCGGSSSSRSPSRF